MQLSIFDAPVIEEPICRKNPDSSTTRSEDMSKPSTHSISLAVAQSVRVVSVDRLPQELIGKAGKISAFLTEDAVMVTIDGKDWGMSVEQLAPDIPEFEEFDRVAQFIGSHIQEGTIVRLENDSLWLQDRPNSYTDFYPEFATLLPNPRTGLMRWHSRGISYYWKSMRHYADRARETPRTPELRTCYQHLADHLAVEIKQLTEKLSSLRITRQCKPQ